MEFENSPALVEISPDQNQNVRRRLWCFTLFTRDGTQCIPPTELPSTSSVRGESHQLGSRRMEFTTWVWLSPSTPEGWRERRSLDQWVRPTATLDETNETRNYALLNFSSKDFKLWLKTY